MNDHDDRSSAQDLLMEGVCADDESSGIAMIDEALARGANFSDDCVEPLFYAAFGRSPRVLAHLIARGATIAAEWPSNRNADDDVHGDTALHAAAEHNDCESLRMLLSADGKDFLERFDEIGRTPLIVAAEEGHLAAASLLIAAGADVDAHDESRIGDTAIKRAVEERRIEMVRLLLAAGADPTIPGWMQLSAIHQAQRARTEGAPILRILREHLGLDDSHWGMLLLPEASEP